MFSRLTGQACGRETLVRGSDAHLGETASKAALIPEYELVFNSEDKIAENIQDIKVPVRIGQLYLLLRESQPCLFLSQNL